MRFDLQVKLQFSVQSVSLISADSGGAGTCISFFALFSKSKQVHILEVPPFFVIKLSKVAAGLEDVIPPLNKLKFYWGFMCCCLVGLHAVALGHIWLVSMIDGLNL